MVVGRQTTNPGWVQSELYKTDPDTQVVPEGIDHSEHRLGMDSDILANLSDNNLLVVNIPTTDQKAALDGNATLNAGNPVASLGDVAAAVAAAYAIYAFRTATDAPADGEVKLDNAAPASATLVRVANINVNGSNIGNILLKLGANDAVVLQSSTTAGDLYNYDITGAPVQVGGAGAGGYVELPVAAFDITGTLSDAETTLALFLFDGNNTRFLQKASNLSDLVDFPTARTNLSVQSVAEADAKYLDEAQNLSDLDNLVTARTNLDVYSKGEANTAFLDALSNLSDLDNAGTARTNLGVAIGSDVQAHDDDLDALAAIAGVNGDIIIRSGGSWVKLAKATDTEILTLVAGLPAWAAPAAGGLPAASDAEMEGATLNTVAATPGRFTRSPFALKAWAYVSAAGALNASEGVTSITKNGTGDYTVNLAITMSTANYCVMQGIEEGGTIQRNMVAHTLTTTAFDVNTGNSGTGSLSDEPFFVGILGDI